MGVVIVAAISLLAVLAQWLVTFIPFEKEQQWLGSIGHSFIQSQTEKHTSVNHQEIETYLQNLANELGKTQGLPEEIKITIHYVESDTVNAFATLGGNVVIFKGLLEKMPHENALSMVMAHEIAHIKHRHPIVALGRGAAIGLSLISLSGIGDGSISQQLIGNIGLLTAMSFSRSQETKSDEEAIETLLNYYGHLEGANVLFHTLQTEYEGAEPPQFFSTHPNTEERIRRIEDIQSDLMMSEKLVAFPQFIPKLSKNEN